MGFKLSLSTLMKSYTCISSTIDLYEVYEIQYFRVMECYSCSRSIILLNSYKIPIFKKQHVLRSLLSEFHHLTTGLLSFTKYWLQQMIFLVLLFH